MPDALAPPPALLRRRLLGGMALAAASAVLFSAKAVVAKLSYRYGVDPVTVVALRMVLAAPVFAAVAGWYRRRDGPLGRRDRLRLAVLGFVGYYGSAYLDFAGLAYVTVGLERLILFLNPTLVVLLAAVLFRRPVGGRAWAALGLSYAGVAVAFAHDLAAGPDAHALGFGAALVFGAALAYAGYLTGVGELVRRLPAVRVSAIALVWAGAGAAVHALAAGAPVAAAPGPVYALAAFNALACTVAPVFLLALAIARVGAPTAAHAGMVGPVATLALGAVVLGEPVTAWAVAGSALVLAGVALLSAAPAAVDAERAGPA